MTPTIQPRFIRHKRLIINLGVIAVLIAAGGRSAYFGYRVMPNPNSRSVCLKPCNALSP